MPFNGAGVFTRVYQWVQQAALGQYVDATQTDTDTNDIADGLTNCVTRDGQSPFLADIPAGGFKITDLGDGASPQDATTFTQVFNSPAFVTPTATTTPTLGSNNLRLATTAYVDQTAFATALPSQTGNSGKAVITNGTAASWGFPGLFRTARTSNTILAAADNGLFFDITSGTFSQTFTAAATLGSGWHVYIRNSGTGAITLDPDGSETIDGAATYLLSPGKYVIVQCTGTAFFTAMVGSVPGTHVVTVTTGNGWGGTNTKIRRFTTALVNTGTAITYADSAADGASFTINQAGLYFVGYWDGANGATATYGASLNSAELTTDIQSITAANRLFAGEAPNTNTPVSAGGSVFSFAAADVVRAHGTGANQTDANVTTMFTIRKLVAL